MATSLGLPESVNYRTSALSNDIVVPDPCLGVDGLPNSSKHLEGASVIPDSIRQVVEHAPLTHAAHVPILLLGHTPV